MHYDVILVRLGELFLKGKNKQRFTGKLFSTICARLNTFEELRIENQRDHFLIELNGTDYTAVLQQLNYIFGIHSFALGKCCTPSMESICETTLPVAIEACSNGNSIKFETRRGDKKFPHTSISISQQVAQYVGTHAPEGTIHFNVPAPDLTLHIFVKPTHALILSKVLPAQGGLPIGLNGKSLLMLSGGLDSPVAGYLLMKRGLEVEAVHFESPPYTTPRARQKVYDLAEKLAHYLPNTQFRLHVVPFTNLQKELFASIPDNYSMTIMRRMMYRICAGLAENQKIRLLANGESLGQVASQTPDSMWAINAVTDLPVLRPVACMDKDEIVAIAKKINTFEISIRPFEDCCTVFVPKSPSTSPKKEKCEKFETRFDWKPLVQECIEQTKVITITAGKTIAVDTETTDDICSLL